MWKPMEPIEMTTTILTFCLLLSNFILMIIMWVDKAKTPEKNQNTRIMVIEDEIKDIYEKIGKDNNRLRELEKGNVVTQEAILALLSHAIDGNNTDGLKKAKDNLQTYLTHKGVTSIE